MPQAALDTIYKGYVDDLYVFDCALKAGSDPLDAAAWEKSRVPVMVTEEKNGLYGPGHNSFTTDEEGKDILVFHARPYPGFRGSALSDPNRHCFLRKVRYAPDGIPVFRDE